MYLFVRLSCIAIISLIIASCSNQESELNEQYIYLEEPHYYGDSSRMFKILKIHEKLLNKQPDNFIYLSNVFQMNCLLGKYDNNVELIKSSMLMETSKVNPEIYTNFYLALNAYRSDTTSVYIQYLEKLNNEDLSHDPLLGYIAARCSENTKLADKYFPEMLEQIRFMPEKNAILRLIESNKCDRFLELYKGVCPVCEICEMKRYI